MPGYSLPLYHIQKHTATKAGVSTTAIVIYAVMIKANGGDVDVQIMDAVTDGGEDELDYSVLNGDTRFFDYSGLGGIAFGTAMSLTTTSNGTITVWTDKPQIAT